MSRRAFALGLLAFLPWAPVTAAAQEQYAIAGEHIAVYNLAGEIEVEGTSGGQVTVQVMRGGRDGAELGIEIGDVDGRQTLRVVYPDTRVTYAARGWSGNTTVRVRRDGTWGGSSGIPFLGGARSVRISNRGGGMEAHADLRIGVPRGQRVDIYVAAGRITADNVDGQVRLDTHSGPVAARRMSGHLTLDTGSGGVEVSGMRGDLFIDTGSGSVEVANVVSDRLVIDTGSGRITLRDAVARDILLDTGSGSVQAEIGGAIERIVIDTGSGNVALRVPEDLDATVDIDTGSGRITTDIPIRVTRQARDELHGIMGEGRGTVRIDTGSGSVRIQAL